MVEVLVLIAVVWPAAGPAECCGYAGSIASSRSSWRRYRYTTSSFQLTWRGGRSLSRPHCCRM